MFILLSHRGLKSKNLFNRVLFLLLRIRYGVVTQLIWCVMLLLFLPADKLYGTLRNPLYYMT